MANREYTVGSMLTETGLSSTLLSRDVENVVAADEGFAVLLLELAVDVFLGVLEGDVHVTVQLEEDASVVDARVELHHHRLAVELLQEIGRSRHALLLLGHSRFRSLLPKIWITIQVDRISDLGFKFQRFRCFCFFSDAAKSKCKQNGLETLRRSAKSILSLNRR